MFLLLEWFAIGKTGLNDGTGEGGCFVGGRTISGRSGQQQRKGQKKLQCGRISSGHWGDMLQISGTVEKKREFLKPIHRKARREGELVCKQFILGYREESICDHSTVSSCTHLHHITFPSTSDCKHPLEIWEYWHAGSWSVCDLLPNYRSKRFEVVKRNHQLPRIMTLCTPQIWACFRCCKPPAVFPPPQSSWELTILFRAGGLSGKKSDQLDSLVS